MENMDAMLPSIMYFTLHGYLYFLQCASGMHIRGVRLGAGGFSGTLIYALKLD